jgi:hypothetical protein
VARRIAMVTRFIDFVDAWIISGDLLLLSRRLLQIVLG